MVGVTLRWSRKRPSEDTVGKRLSFALLIPQLSVASKKSGTTRLIDNVRISVKIAFMTNIMARLSVSQAYQRNYKHTGFVIL